jgi:hypothetical protein
MKGRVVGPSEVIGFMRSGSAGPPDREPRHGRDALGPMHTAPPARLSRPGAKEEEGQGRVTRRPGESFRARSNPKETSSDVRRHSHPRARSMTTPPLGALIRFGDAWFKSSEW